jgi:hypothetical protein
MCEVDRDGRSGYRWCGAKSIGGKFHAMFKISL